MAAPKKSPAGKGAPAKSPAGPAKTPATTAAGYLAKRHQQHKDLRTRQKAARAQGADRERIRQASESGRKSAQPLGRAVAKFPRKALLAELVVCLVIVWGGALVAPQGKNNGTTRALVKTSGLAAVFLVLALVSSSGKGAAKAASAFGGLVALAYVFTSGDAVALASWVSGFWSKDGVGGVGPVGPDGAVPGTGSDGGGQFKGRPLRRPTTAEASSTPERGAAA